ncbi:MAG: tRNA (adenosine(37)-N6)-dimethylallyltransferase MiaA [Candidatus Daviesbacteria bacterium]|nr:tRNA (adenosine(37)-N6)-dimethylallyltransferase MiaA [Candidatus Daviesbacteria bacterium]
MKKVLVILGPTATGKTDVALRLSANWRITQGKPFNFPQCELVSCDSRQIYTGLDIGTGKMPSNNHPELVRPEQDRRVSGSGSRNKFGMTNRNDIKRGKGYWEINRIKIWMYDVCDPKIQFNVKDYVIHAEKVIEDILKRGKLPIIVGGTGFYLKALLEGLPNLEIPINKKLRRELEKLNLKALQNKLQKLSPEKWENLNNSDRQNPRRFIRAIEIASTNSTSEEFLRATIRGGFKKYDVLKTGLTAPREVLNKRIDSRLVSRLDQGMVEEAKNLHKDGLSFTRMKELGLEYGMLAKLLAGEISENQLVDQLSAKIHQYAKRQMTWFRSENSVFWFDITSKNWTPKMEKIVLKWYDGGNDNTQN